jgi:hypothetical protein
MPNLRVAMVLLKALLLKLLLLNLLLVLLLLNLLLVSLLNHHLLLLKPQLLKIMTILTDPNIMKTKVAMEEEMNQALTRMVQAQARKNPAIRVDQALA